MPSTTLRLIATLLLMAFSPPGNAESIGLRFIVHEDIGPRQEQKDSIRRKIHRDVDTLNQFFLNSKVNLSAEVVDIAYSNIVSNEAVALLEDMSHERRGFEHLFSRAGELGADYTFGIIRGLIVNGRRGCGRALAVNKTIEEISSTRRALAVMDYACTAQTLAHELGHLMGLNHGHLVDVCDPGRGHTTALTPYANGYGQGECDGKPDKTKFGTIMVGGWMKSVNGDGRDSLPFFSNPEIRDPRCGKSGVCGNSQIGDAARALNEHARYYSMHEEPDAHAIKFASRQLSHCVATKYKSIKVSRLTVLDCRSFGIENLEGIERLTALRVADLRENRILDATPLSGLALKLERLALTGNPALRCASAQPLTEHLHGNLELPDHCK